MSFKAALAPCTILQGDDLILYSFKGWHLSTLQAVRKAEECGSGLPVTVFWLDGEIVFKVYSIYGRDQNGFIHNSKRSYESVQRAPD